MTFLKILMAVVLLSAVLSKESWAQGEPNYQGPMPQICITMITHFVDVEDYGDFDYFKKMKKLDIDQGNERYYPKNKEEFIRKTYNDMAKKFKDKTLSADPEKRSKAEQTCALNLNDQKSKLASNLAQVDIRSEKVSWEDIFTDEATERVHETKAAAPSSGTCVGKAVEECSDEPVGISLDPDLSDWVAYEARKNSILMPAILDHKAKTKAYDPTDCKCHHDNLILANKSTEQLGPEIDQQIQKIKNLIVEESAKKFINNYAAVNEDLRYIGSAEAKILGYHGGEKYSDKEKLCQDPEGFIKEVSELCAKNGTTAGSMERMSSILSAVDPKLKSMSFSDALKALNDDIGVLELPKSTVKPGQPSILYRSEYDKGRRSIGVDDLSPTLKFANRMIIELLKKPDLEKAIQAKVNEGQEPLTAILNVMTDPKNDKLMDKVLENMSEKFKTFKNGDLFEKLATLKDQEVRHKTKDTNQYENELSKLFGQAMQISPKMKNLLMDGKLYSGISKKFWPSDRHVEIGLLGLMSEDKTQLMNSLANRCSKVQRELAQNVCAKPDEVLKNASTDDVLELVKDPKYVKSPDDDVMNMALCRFSANQPNKDSVFSDVIVNHGNPHMHSDYLGHKINPNKKNSYTKLARKLLDDDYAKALQRMVNYSVSEDSSIAQFKSSNNIDSNQLFSSKPRNAHSSDMSTAFTQSLMQDANTTSSASRDVASVSSSEIGKTISAPTSVMNPATYAPPTSSTFIASPDEVKNAESVENISRDRLAKELGGSENKTRVKEHISSVDEKDAEEIFRLRDQAMKDRQTISELRLQQERDKTEALRGEYEQLKARFDNLEKAGPAPVAAAPNITSGGTGSSASGGTPHFETATLAAPVVAAGSTGGRASGMASPSSMGGSASLGDSNSGSSNAAGAGSSVTTTASASGGASDSRGLALTVTQSVGADGKVSSVEDPNKALINYLTKNEPTEKQLQELKTSGLVLTEEDVSKDGQKVQTKKMIKFHELSPEAKSLVEKKLAQVKLQEVKRNYSRQALILELFTASSKKSNLNVKKSGSLNF